MLIPCNVGMLEIFAVKVKTPWVTVSLIEPTLIAGAVQFWYVTLRSARSNPQPFWATRMIWLAPGARVRFALKVVPFKVKLLTGFPFNVSDISAGVTPVTFAFNMKPAEVTVVLFAF